MRCPNTDKNLYCNVVNTLFEREVPYYCHRIDAPNVITPCASQGKVYLLNNDLTTSVIRELNGKNFPACFNNLNGSESRKRIGCQSVRAQLCPVADNLLSPYLTNLLCQLSAMNNNSKSCLWGTPILPKKLSCMELAVLVGLLNALRYNTGPYAYTLATGLKAKLVEEILTQYGSTSCGRTPDCAKVHVAEQILPEVERVLEKLRSCPAPASSTCGRDQAWSQQVEDMALRLGDLAQVILRGRAACMVRDLVLCARSLTSPLLCESRKRQLAGDLMCQLNKAAAQISDDLPGCSARRSQIMGALARLQDAVAHAVCQLNCKSNLVSCDQNAVMRLSGASRGCKYNVTTPDSCSDIVVPTSSSPRCLPPRCTCCCSAPSCSYVDVPATSRCEVVTASTSASNSRPESVCGGGVSSSRCRSRSHSRSGSDKGDHKEQQQQLSSAVGDHHGCFGSNMNIIQEPACTALNSAISQLKELKLCINGPQVVGYVKSPKTLCEAIYSDLKNSPYLRAHLFRPRRKKRKPKYHYIEIKSTDPCNPLGFFLEFVL